MPQKAEQLDGDQMVVPVADPHSGAIHQILVPLDAPTGEFHDAMVLAGYADHQPTAAGALENSPEFRKAASKAVRASEVLFPNAPASEAGFVVSGDGKSVKEAMDGAQRQLEALAKRL